MIKQSKKILALCFLLFFGIYFRYLFSHLTRWSHEEGVILWIGLTKSIFSSPFSNVSSPGIPNPNLSILISKFLNIFISFETMSIVLSTIQTIIIFYLLKSTNKRFNLILLLFLSFSSYFVFVISSIALHKIVLIFNALFLKLVFEYCLNKKYYLASYFPVVTIMPVSMYLGGFSNTLIFFITFMIILIVNFKNFKNNFISKPHLITGFSLLLFVTMFTWLQYFSNLDFELLRIQNDSRLFPYTRIRDYIFLGFQNTKIFLPFFLNVFSDFSFSYWPFQYSDKFSIETINFYKYLFNFHGILNAISLVLIFSGFLITTTKFKKIVKIEELLKSTFTFFFIYIYTILTPLLGQGRSFLDFDIGSLMVYSSTFVLFIYLWSSSLSIFELSFVKYIFLLLLLSVFFLLNIFATKNLQNEFIQKKSSFHSIADESVIHKEEIVDFLANYVEDEIAIYYGFIEFEYTFSNDFNKLNYSNPYYQFIYSNGREFDYLLKRKYGIKNSQEGILKRSYEDTQFFISYSFDEIPDSIYQKYSLHKFGNYIVLVNLEF